MAKQSIQEIIRTAWFRETQRHPEKKADHGSDGWRVYLNNRNLSLEGRAVLFGVSWATPGRWEKRINEEVEVG